MVYFFDIGVLFFVGEQKFGFVEMIFLKKWVKYHKIGFLIWDSAAFLSAFG